MIVFSNMIGSMQLVLCTECVFRPPLFEENAKKMIIIEKYFFFVCRICALITNHC
jgi:hypothetical protein